MTNPTASTFPKTDKATPLYVDFDAWDTLLRILVNLQGWSVNIDGQDVTISGQDEDDALSVYDGLNVDIAAKEAAKEAPRLVTEIGRVYIY